MSEILARARARGVQSEVFEITSHETSIEFENNRLKRAETVERAGLAVRVIAQGRIGFATSSLPADLPGLLDQALATAVFGKEARFAFPGPCQTPETEVFDRIVPEISPEELVAYGEELIEPLRAADPKFKSAVSLTAGMARTSLANTSGFAGELHRTIFGGSVGGILVEGENFLDLTEGYFSCRRQDNLRPLRDRVLAHLRQGRTNALLLSGKYRVLFAPTATVSLLGPLLACLNGKAVEKETSPFRGRLGEEAFAAAFTLLDDPLQPYTPATASFDAEGLPGARTPLIERGILRNFLVDLDTAAALQVKPNGNGRRGGWSSPPAPGASTLVVEGGTEPSPALLAGLENGLFVHHLLGAGQGNPYGGTINANILLGFLVHGGEIVGRVKNTMLTTNVFDLFRSQLLALSRDQEHVWGSMILPYVLADGVAITAKEG